MAVALTTLPRYTKLRVFGGGLETRLKVKVVTLWKSGISGRPVCEASVSTRGEP